MTTRLLIVDDQDDYRTALAARLTDAGFDVATAEGGQQAVEHVRRRDVDVVLLDVLMPDQDGVEALVQIKRHRPYAEVILLTGHARLPKAIEALEQGAFDYLLKPCPFEHLLGRIESACEARRLNLRVAKGE